MRCFSGSSVLVSVSACALNASQVPTDLNTRDEENSKIRKGACQCSLMDIEAPKIEGTNEKGYHN